MFLHATKIVPLTNYTSGVSNLHEFQNNVSCFEEIELLKQAQLSNDDIGLILDYNKHGIEYLETKHKNIDKTMLHDRINKLLSCISNCCTNTTRFVINKFKVHRNVNFFCTTS